MPRLLAWITAVLVFVAGSWGAHATVVPGTVPVPSSLAMGEALDLAAMALNPDDLDAV
jgi:hypothetical protein